MQKTHSIVWVTAALAVAGCSNIGEQIKSSGAMGSEDTAYIQTAYELEQLDNQTGKLVQSKAQDPRVAFVSSQLMDQANALSPGLAGVLKSQGITPPQQLPANIASEVDQLRSLNGAAFDQAYLADEIALHKQAVEVFQKEDADTKNSAMRTQVEAELPAVKNDLDSLQDLTSKSS